MHITLFQLWMFNFMQSDFNTNNYTIILEQFQKFKKIQWSRNTAQKPKDDSQK